METKPVLRGEPTGSTIPNTFWVESSRSCPHISVESEVALGSVLPCDDTVPAVHPGDHHPLELLGCHDLHRHDRLQDGTVGLLHR